MPRIVRDIQLLVNDNDDHLYGYRLSDGTEVRIGTSNNLDFDVMTQLFGDDEMIIGTYVNRPLATLVAVGKEFMATDLGNMRWVSDGTQWILLKPCQIAGDATQQSIVDSVGQGTTESTL
ncbi:MAG: hypothetical protein ACOY9J_13550, partial [Pseudomonadota bacterium]